MRLPLLDQRAREALPSGCQRAGELLGKVVYGRGSRDVEVGREARSPIAQAHLDGATSLDGAVRQHLGDDRVRYDCSLGDEIRLPDESFERDVEVLLLFGRFAGIRVLQLLLQ